MATLDARLMVLEQRSSSRRYPSGLGQWNAVCNADGPAALLERLDGGTATDEDRAIIADMRGGEKWLRELKSSLAHLYGEAQL
ncbi:MAG: hypothetical protein WAW69_06190 [Polaromonas sp.]